MKTISTKRAEKIARNINAMDLYYQYSDDMRVWKFWSNLDSKLRTILSTLTNTELDVLRPLCEEDKESTLK